MSMSAGGSNPGEVSSEINVTPMIDVLLVLLIIFMITQPLSRMAMDIQVPPPDTPQTNQQPSFQIVLELRDDGTYAINSQPYPKEQARRAAARHLRRAPGQADVRQGGPEPDLPGRHRGDGHRARGRRPGHRVHAEGRAVGSIRAAGRRPDVSRKPAVRTPNSLFRRAPAPASGGGAGARRCIMEP